MKLKAIKNHIIFQFVDKTDSKGQFVETTDWGFQIQGHFDNSAKAPRWVNIIDVGPDCEFVKPGQQALVHALKWTMGFKCDDVRYWRTDETQLAAVRKNAKSEITALNDTVIFHRHDELVKEGNHGLQIVGDTEDGDTPSGTVKSLGSKCEKELTKALIYFKDESLYNKFEHKDEMLWYIPEADILAFEPA